MQKPTNKKSNKKCSIKEILPKRKNTYKKNKKQDSTISNISQEKLSKSFLSSDTTIKKLVEQIPDIKNNDRKEQYLLPILSSGTTIKKLVKQIPVIKETKNNVCKDEQYLLPSERKYGQSKTINNQNREELEKALADISAIKPINKRNDKPTVSNKQPIICSLEGGIVKTGKSGCPCCPF